MTFNKFVLVAVLALASVNAQPQTPAPTTAPDTPAPTPAPTPTPTPFPDTPAPTPVPQTPTPTPSSADTAAPTAAPTPTPTPFDYNYYNKKCSRDCDARNYWSWSCTYPDATTQPIPGTEQYQCACNACHTAGYYSMWVAVWVVFVVFAVAACVSYGVRRNRPAPTPPITTGAPYVVTRTPPRGQSQQAQQAYIVDGLVVPAWMAQEQQQQVLAQQQAAAAAVARGHPEPNPLQQQQKEEDAQRFAKDNKMTVVL